MTETKAGLEYEITIAKKEDVKDLFSLIKDLAEYEKLSHEVTGTEAELEKYLFDPEHRVAEALIVKSSSGQAIGLALYFYNFSTFLTKPGIYLEDLYVKPEFRNYGIGKKLFERLKERANEKNCGRIEWAVLDWNTPSIEFYKNSMGAKAMDEWTTYRLEKF
ncbi:MAG: GNAT family N-acetyltransferase [Candidatus Caenarcaniphilales bacterium]|nr:GNAT family N-acetyltransferase [Candidatus Caenarcaniphilales bacterium]